jgi:ketosteroid isomerase-like protein
MTLPTALPFLQAAFVAASPLSDPAAVLDAWHLAAAQCDESRYFGLMTENAVFLGTDASERWSREQFRAWAAPFFKRGKAWVFRASRRTVSFSKAGDVAWFEEDLETPNLGPARGSGVLVKSGHDWRIAQYNLSVPIPNGVFKEVKALIEKSGRP